MTTTIFIALLIYLGTLTTIVVEFVKAVFDKKQKAYDSVNVAIATAVFVGLFGTIVYYLRFGIPFTLLNIIWILCETACVVIGSQIGYDKLAKALFEAIAKVITKSE